MSQYVAKCFMATALSSSSCSRKKNEKAFSVLDRMHHLSSNAAWLLFSWINWECFLLSDLGGGLECVGVCLDPFVI